jgi:cob(I)alamin adenosyltransferase
MPIYSKTGDAGITGLYDGKRVKKSVEVVEVLGELDELNAFLGSARLAVRKNDAKKISQIQSDLFILGATVAGAKLNSAFKDHLKEQISEMEESIDKLDKKLPGLRNFILPNGCEASVRLHLTRAICRRCERSLVALGLYVDLIPYINRLSDYLFVLARFENHRRGINDELVSSDQQ